MSATRSEIEAWFGGRIPKQWFQRPPEIMIDRDEILVIGTLPDVTPETDAAEDARAVAEASRIKTFREETRDERVRIASDAETVYDRKVSWGAASGDRRVLFTHLSIPVMTRLRLPERSVLDTLVKAGVARNRSDALAWCVRLVGKNESEWLDGLRQAFAHVEKARAKGPDV